MKLQNFNIITLFILFVTTLSMHSMEQENKELYSFFHLPVEIQQQIVFPLVTQITEDNADELQESIKTFFKFNRVCTYVNKNLIFPWMALELATKNRMMQEVNALMTKISHKECLIGVRSCDLYFHQHREKVSFGYNKYCAIALALVSSGADPDIIDSTFSTTLIYKAVHAQDVLAVELLLNYHADPYQESFDEDQLIVMLLDDPTNVSQWWDSVPHYPIFFHVTTEAILALFLKKIDKNIVLSMPYSKLMISLCRYNHYSPEVMQAWLAYGIPANYIWNDDLCILHICVHEYYQNPFDFKDTNSFLKKLELLLKVIPNMVNKKNDRGKTPMDIASYDWSDKNEIIDVHEKIIALLRKYGGKTAQELEVENV